MLSVWIVEPIKFEVISSEPVTMASTRLLQKYSNEKNQEVCLARKLDSYADAQAKTTYRLAGSRYCDTITIPGNNKSEKAVNTKEDGNKISGHNGAATLCKAEDLSQGHRSIINSRSLFLKFGEGHFLICNNNFTTQFNRQVTCKKLDANWASINIPKETNGRAGNASSNIRMNVMTVTVDANGIFHAEAAKSFRGKRYIVIPQKADTQRKSELSEMTKEATIYRDQEAKKKDAEVAKANLEKYVYNLKRKLEATDNGDIISDDYTRHVQDQCYKMLDFIDENETADKNMFVSKLKEFRRMFQPLMNKLGK